MRLLHHIFCMLLLSGCSTVGNWTIELIRFTKELRLVYKDYISSFDDLLAKDNSFKIHQRNLQKLAIEIFKVKKGIAPAIMNNIFEFNDNPYSLRNDTAYFKSRNVRTVRYGIETASFVGPRIWNSIPFEIKEPTSLHIFKSKIKNWTLNCPCKLCKNYFQHLGYLKMAF